MEPVFDFGLEATRWMQAVYPQLAGFFRFISSLGQETFFLAALPLIFWCWDKRLGSHLAYVFLVSHGLNSLGKHAFRGPRPFWLDSGVGLSEETSYGVPSGHTESAMVFYGFLALWLRKRWMTALAIFMVVAMGVSRIYLGVHFVHDVAAGLLVAVIVLAIYWFWREYGAERFGKRILGQRLLLAFLVPIGLAVMYTAVRFIIGAPDMSVSWSAFIPDAELEGLEAVATAVGALLGWGIGLNLEKSRVRFRTDGPLWQRAARYIVGMVVTLAFYFGLKVVFPEDPLWLGIILRIVRYTVTLLWVAYYGPMFFVRIRLATADPDPGIQMTL